MLLLSIVVGLFYFEISMKCASRMTSLCGAASALAVEASSVVTVLSAGGAAVR